VAVCFVSGDYSADAFLYINGKDFQQRGHDFYKHNGYPFTERFFEQLFPSISEKRSQRLIRFKAFVER
jgi:hypothetical protein